MGTRSEYIAALRQRSGQDVDDEDTSMNCPEPLEDEDDDDPLDEDDDEPAGDDLDENPDAWLNAHDE